MLFVLLLLLIALVTWYRLRVARPPSLVYQNTAANRALLERLPRLRRPFRPLPWAWNAHLQMLVYLWVNGREPPLDYDERETLRMADGGTTGLCWLGLDAAPGTPTLLVLPTIAGCNHSMRAVVRELRRLTGWRLVVCLRRGHGRLPLTAPRYNTLGDTADLREQIARIQQRDSASPLYAIGVSAGSGLLVRYLGEQGEDTPIRAAMAHCPGYDVAVALSRARPFYSRMMGREMARNYIRANAAMLGQAPGFAACAAADDLASLHRHLHGVAGHASYADYLAASNPAPVMPRVQVPLLILNAADDPVCVVDNVEDHRDLIATMPNVLLALTARGSHCAFFEGWRPRSWANRLAAEYFLAVAAIQHR